MIDSNTITFFKNLLGEAQVLTDPSECLVYGYDNSRYQGVADVVLFPTTHQQVVDIVIGCYQHQIPLYTRGKGTGTTGAAVPLQGGVVLSLERMNRILQLDVDNRVMVVEPGITNEEVQLAAAKKGFFWAPDPSSASVCTVGGNLACNAAGPRAVKYGTCRENTLGLKAVTGSGNTIRTGVYTTKGVVGYDLTRLLIGSEGTLAIITEANLKLLPLPEAKRTMQLLYKDLPHCTQGITAIMASPIIPCTLEFMDQKAIAMIRDYAKVDIPPETAALLMVEVDGLRDSMAQATQIIKEAANNEGLVRFSVAQTQQEAEQLWRMRKSLSPALRHVAPKKINEDVVVPISTLPAFIEFSHQCAANYKTILVTFGHAGNGNIHVNLLYDPQKAQQQQNAYDCLERIFAKVIELKGTLSGEHGVGVDKRDHISKELDSVSLQIMKKLKNIFDPKAILNPEKVLPK